MSSLWPDGDVSRAYVELRARVVALLRDAPSSTASREVPHCPNWSVTDLAAHMLGVPDDIVNGRMEGVASDAWTLAQVERHRDKSLEEIAVELERVSTSFDSMLPHIPPMARSQMVMDAVTHEHDLRHALGVPGARESLAVGAALAWLREWCENRAAVSFDALASGEVSGFDLLRSLTGRRAKSQIEAVGIRSDLVEKMLTGSPLRIPQREVVE